MRGGEKVYEGKVQVKSVVSRTGFRGQSGGHKVPHLSIKQQSLVPESPMTATNLKIGIESVVE